MSPQAGGASMRDDGPSPSDQRDWDDYHDALARGLRWQKCQCGGDMPGRCPGPANCPMCEPSQDETDEARDA
jgi:hypothetical protein